MRISRRAVVAGAVTAPLFGGAARGATAVSVSLNPASRLGALPADFMGLGYEISSVSADGVLSAKNRSYVKLVRNLGRQGVIRVGGNTSDFSRYDARGAAVSAPKTTVVNAENLRELRGFLDAINWKLIWGLNLGADNLDNAVAEARAVMEAAGPRLLALEIGNEPDLFSRAGHRKGNYDYAAWHAEFRRYKTAIRAALPKAPFAGPDIAGTAVDWFEGFARDEGGDAVLLTGHHYIGGQANPTSTMELMLAEEKKYQPALAKFQAIAAAAHLPYRICETASYSGGGKAGVSDSFASALWVLDYLFVLASYGCSGVNMETGVNHLGWISHYTPISDDMAGHYGAAPEYYGLLAFAQMAKGERIATACEAGGVNLTAHGMATGRDVTVAVINKDMSQDASVEISAPGVKQAHAMRLTAPSVTAMNGVKLGGSGVARDGAWSGRSERVTVAQGKARLDLPKASAALVTLTV